MASEAYQKWVEVEYIRLDFALMLEHASTPNFEHAVKTELDLLTKEQKKRRLLFAKGRKKG